MKERKKKQLETNVNCDIEASIRSDELILGKIKRENTVESILKDQTFSIFKTRCRHFVPK